MKTENVLFIGALMGVLGVSALAEWVSKEQVQLSWTEQACVTTVDHDDARGKTTTRHCVSGEELARWAKEHGR